MLLKNDNDAISRLMTGIIMDIHSNGAIDPYKLEQLSYIKCFHPTVFTKYENELLYVLGLFYKTKPPKSFFESCYQIFADTIQEATNERFTPIQADILNHILEHKYFSFSAPTSVGKSHLFRHLIKTAKNDVVIIVPSRALIAEYLLEIVKIVGNDVLVLQFIDNINIRKTSRRVFVVTPERAREIFKWKNQFKIDVFLFDEAQITEEYMRGMLFDALVRRIDRHFPDSKKVFAHPFVENPEAQFIKHNINKDTSKHTYAQQTVGKIYLTTKDEKFAYFSPFETSPKEIAPSDIVLEKLKENGATLLAYVSKASIYDGTCMKRFEKYIDLCAPITDKPALKIIEQLEEYIGASNSVQSIMITMMKRGIVIHHGSIPLYGRMLIERFVKGGYAKICFSTSTLIQGINMPFDIVWIDSFRFTGSDSDRNIALKNLIGRAGRTSASKSFDYGYVIISERNRPTFTKRLKSTANLSETSLLNEELNDIDTDLQDAVSAIKDDSFNDEYLLPEIQVERIKQADIDDSIKCILDNLMIENVPLKHREYNALDPQIKNAIKESFEQIYVSHLRRDKLETGEKSVLSTSISMLLWIIQGRTFSAILANRYAFITDRDKQREIERRYNNGFITLEQRNKELDSIQLKFSQIAVQIPNSRYRRSVPLFGTKDKSPALLKDFKYDTLIFDTYDYMDKVIYFCLATPLAAAFQQYYDKTKDERALAMKNYIKYGTNEPHEIWLSRYGFSFEHIDWIKDYINHIDENGIEFKQKINDLDEEKKEIIRRFI